ncbi:DddA-like double-stranded DNA deaminase toxin [Actinopolyspora halophila]|uniref:DddA-like double-stranded DNA deaminase toxin n=1 Tax=Actinopolyspora halophila TaxID=1850 RepID=UPI00039FC773|nr:DddA-like double-stranded DNA deaminase toxin [Actinopolyspora halophila]
MSIRFRSAALPSRRATAPRFPTIRAQAEQAVSDAQDVARSDADERATGRQATPFTRAGTEAQAGTVSSLEELGEQLALVLAKLAEARTALAQARNRIGESGQTLAAVVDEDTHLDLLAGVSAYREVWSTTTEVGTTITALDGVLRAYMTSIGAPGAETAGIPSDDGANSPSAAMPTGPEPHQQDATAHSEDEPEFGTPAWAGHKVTSLTDLSETAGNVFDDEDNQVNTEPWRSGEHDVWFEQNDQELRASSAFPSISPRAKAVPSASHVETKVARWLDSQPNLNHVTIVINKTVICQGRFGCEAAVRALLSAGRSVSVWPLGSEIPYELKGAKKS